MKLKCKEKKEEYYDEIYNKRHNCIDKIYEKEKE